MEPNDRTAVSRDLGIDLLKTIAIFGVIVIHTSGDGYSNPIGSFDWFSAVFWGSIARASVPVFLMCSGALLLNPRKEKTIRDVYFKNILRIILAMFVWSMAYKIYHLLCSGTWNLPAFIHAVKEVLLFKQEYHMYYLHIILLVYAFLPITRVFIRHATQKELRYALAVWFVLGILYPTVKPDWPFTLLGGIPAQWLMNMTYASIGYGILGYYLTRYPLSGKCSFFLFGFGFLFVFGMTILSSMKTQTLAVRFLEGMSFGVSLLAAGLFGLCYGRKERISGKAAALAVNLSRGSFCVYLVHVFVIYLFAGFGIGANAFPCLLSIPLLAALNLLISYGCYFVLSKIPVVRRWLV